MITAPNWYSLASVYIWNSFLKSGKFKSVSLAIERLIDSNDSSHSLVHFHIDVFPLRDVSGARMCDLLCHISR